MKKKNLIISVAILFFSCGTNAEKNPDTEELQKKKIESIIEESNIERTFDNVIVDEDVVKNITIKIQKEEVIEAEDGVIEKIVETKEILVDFTKEKVDTSNVEELVEEIELPIIVDILPISDHHSEWDELLKKNVSSIGKVNYKGMKNQLAKLSNYLKFLENNEPKTGYSKHEKLVYWLNLYNASTVYLIVSNYPISSITKLSGGKPWDKKFVKSGDKVYSLNQIENEIVRPRFKDSRIHAALNCGAVSCPNLLNEAFDVEKLEAQLDKQTRVWVNDITKNKLTPSKIEVSKIFEWYAADFKSEGGVVKFLSKYSIKKFLIDPKAKIKYLEYNWALNE